MTEAAPHPATDRFRWLVCQALAAIPSHREPACSAAEIARRLCEMCDAADRPAFEEAEAAVRCALAMLDLFGALATSNDEGHRTAGQVSTYFLRSLAWYVEHSIPLVDGWRARGLQGDAGASALDHAPDFLGAMERRRLAVAARLGLDAPASRRQEAVLILIKGILDGEVYYLHQFDSDARRYQLIGGRVEPGEALLVAALRELNEELGIAAGCATLYPLIAPPACIVLTAISSTYGALTDYAFSTFGAALDTREVVLRPGDRWLSVAEMLDANPPVGRLAHDVQLMRALDRRLPGGLRGAPIPPVEIHTLPDYRDYLGLP